MIVILKPLLLLKNTLHYNNLDELYRRINEKISIFISTFLSHI